MNDSLYITDLRAQYDRSPDCAGIVLRLSLIGGGFREYALRIPKIPDVMAKDYLHAQVYNIISSLGGREMMLFADDCLLPLASGVGKAFDVGRSKKDRRGYGRAVNVADRILEALGLEAFRFIAKPMTEYRAVQSADVDADTAEDVFDVPCIAQKSIVGMDIGGTDIKAVCVRNGEIVRYLEYDWFPALFTDCKQLVDPICAIVKELAGGGKIDAIGLCFPDVVIRDKIVGGEVYKTRGIRQNPGIDYDQNFKQLTDLNETLQKQFGCSVKMTNDGPMAAFTAALEAEAAGKGMPDGVFAYTLGTELGTGWVTAAGMIPEIPLEVYNLIIDLGSDGQKAYDADDIRSVINFNTGLAGTLQKYTSQSGVFRLAMQYMNTEEIADLFDKGFVKEENGRYYCPYEPQDMRKPFLEYMMALAEDNENAKAIFRTIGEYLAVTWFETEWLLSPKAKPRTLFGRLVKNRACYELMLEGAKRLKPDVVFEAADASMANTPLMKQLDNHPDYTVAQFAQAVGAVYYAAM